MAFILQMPLAILGARLREARNKIQLNQQQVADKLGYARTTLVAIEAGKRTITSPELRAFTALYEIRESELLSQSVQPLDLQVKFRSHVRSPADEVHVASTAALLNSLAAATIELEQLLRVKSDAADHIHWALSKDEPLEQQAEDAALLVRQRLGIGHGPLTSLLPILESELGLRIFERPLHSKISGAFVFDDEHGGFMLLNNNHPIERRRNTAAHELGHFLQRRPDRSVLMSDQTFSEKEDRFCDSFGRAFLMPAVAVRKKVMEMKSLSGAFSVRHMLWMSDYFFVSVEALIRRLEALQLIQRGTFDSLKEDGLGGKHLEAARKEIGVALPQPHFSPRLLLLAREAFERGLLSEQQIASRLKLDIVTVRDLMSDESERESGKAELAIS